MKIIAAFVVAILFMGWIAGALKESESEMDATEAVNTAVDDQNSRKDVEPEPISPPPPPPSPWSVTEKTSPVDDSKSVWLTTHSNETVPHRYRSGGAAPAMLQIRCMENTTALYIEFNGQHMASSPYQNWGDVVVRVDANDARTISMDASTDNSLLGLFRGGQSIPLIRSMMGAERFLVRATPFNGSPITVTFNVSGLDEKIAPLRKACHW
ncbi:type VI secretion protein [Halomonas cupida]|uniref:type VI secretion system-associated protein TagO n=1 Tax=Halomonas cupida TaxID=44933 RepID=UPI0039B3F94C